MRYCGHFLIKAEGGAKNYKRDHPLPLSWRPFTVVFVQRRVTPRNVHDCFQTLLTPILTIFTDFLSAVVTSEIAQILSLYGGGFLALKWKS